MLSMNPKISILGFGKHKPEKTKFFIFQSLNPMFFRFPRLPLISEKTFKFFLLISHLQLAVMKAISEVVLRRALLE